MKLSSEDYRRGVVSWAVDSPATVETATAATLEAPTIWAPPLVDPAGSVVESGPERFMQIKIVAKDASALSRPWEVRWERIWDDRLTTAVWNNATPGQPIVLEHIPTFGIFHRLVVRTPFLEVANGVVLRVGSLVVRFVIGRVSGEKAEPFDTVQLAPDQIAITGGPIGGFQEEGRFIEIVAPGETPDQAELNAYSTLGLIAAAMGPHAVSEVLFSERHENVRADGHGAVATSTIGRNPWFVSDDVVELVHGALPALDHNGRRVKALALALRWYERGCRGETALDRLLAYFVGIEAVVTAFAIEQGPLPEVAERQEQYEAIEADLDRLVSGDKITLKKLRDKLVEPALADRFRFYATQQGWDEAVVDQFSQVAKARNKLFHGSSLFVDAASARKAERLLGRIVRRELALPETVEWETLPLIFPVRSEGRVIGSTADLSGTVFQPDD
jgi:hypothetical protein